MRLCQPKKRGQKEKKGTGYFKDNSSYNSGKIKES